MSRCCDGDEAAFLKLYDRVAPEVFVFLRTLVDDEALVDVLLQKTFLSFVRGRGRYVRSMGVRAWVLTIADNAARSDLRRRTAAVRDRPA